jgi:hypothetical protein
MDMTYISIACGCGEKLWIRWRLVGEEARYLLRSYDEWAPYKLGPVVKGCAACGNELFGYVRIDREV